MSRGRPVDFYTRGYLAAALIDGYVATPFRDHSFSTTPNQRLQFLGLEAVSDTYLSMRDLVASVALCCTVPVSTSSIHLLGIGRFVYSGLLSSSPGQAHFRRNLHCLFARLYSAHNLVCGRLVRGQFQ